MKKIIYIALALVGMMAVSCQKEKKVTVDPALLIGRWTAPSQLGAGKIGFVFQNGVCDLKGIPAGTRWGYQWDEGNDVMEADVLAEAHYGPDWFGWALSADSTTILLYSSSATGQWEGYTTSNTVTAFSASQMTMMDAGNTYVLTKQN